MKIPKSHLPIQEENSELDNGRGSYPQKIRDLQKRNSFGMRPHKKKLRHNRYPDNQNIECRERYIFHSKKYRTK